MLRSLIAIASAPFFIACTVAEPPQVTCVVTGGGGDGNVGGSAGSGGTPNGGGDPSATGGASSLPEGEWVNVTNNLAGLEAACGNSFMVSAKPDEDVVFAGITNGGIWKSTNGGESWDTNDGLRSILGGPSSFVYDPVHPATFWVSAIYGWANGDGAPIAYRTDDGGLTFTRLGLSGHNDLISVDFSDPERKTLLAGGHEQSQKAYLSHDGGDTWTEVGASLPGDSGFSANPVVIDSQTFLMGITQGGIYRSADGARTWTKVSDVGGGTFPLVATSGAIYWPTTDSNTVVKSTDGGETWTPLEAKADLWAVPMLELPDGRIVAVGKQSLLALSEDEESWTPLTPLLPFVPRGAAYSSQQKAFFTWYSTCATVVADDAFRRFDFDYEAN